MEDINLDTPDIMDAKEAAKIWGKNNGYVRTYYKQNPDKFPSGSIRKFGQAWVVTTKAMEAITGEKDPRKKE
ncbi:helix-turn-helix domain-containing protein [Limosilactobacillus reuteri subsp. suis]|uniref:helix-turn-helix domain-containing protein n=1 Tax=Limosilactobacillus reuteri TaxID=1598 RepID=UPI0039920B51